MCAQIMLKLMCNYVEESTYLDRIMIAMMMFFSEHTMERLIHKICLYIFLQIEREKQCGMSTVHM